jgi:uncharacterized coiled-coil protein SlyX
MRVSVLVWLSIGSFSMLCGQKLDFQGREQMNVQERVEHLEERFAARSEDIKSLTDDLTALKTEIKTVREEAIAAKTLSESDRDRVDQIAWVGRLILGAVAFLVGVIVTQLVSKFMASRRPRVVRPTA